jgi:hypothetical protein
MAEGFVAYEVMPGAPTSAKGRKCKSVDHLARQVDASNICAANRGESSKLCWSRPRTNWSPGTRNC